MDGWMDGWMGSIDGRLDGWDQFMDGWIDGWMNGRIRLLLYLSAPRWDYCSRYFSIARPPEVPSTVHS